VDGDLRTSISLAAHARAGDRPSDNIKVLVAGGAAVLVCDPELGRDRSVTIPYDD